MKLQQGSQNSLYAQADKIRAIIDPAFMVDVDFSQEKEEFERYAALTAPRASRERERERTLCS
jgi:hypothetical protein